LAGEHQRLREAAHQFEGVFIAQLFREMRATIPTDEAAPGQELFTGLLDETIANQAAERSTRGIGEALYRQLAARIGPAAPISGLPDPRQSAP
jgi:Rod binding domain-containing protein